MMDKGSLKWIAMLVFAGLCVTQIFFRSKLEPQNIEPTNTLSYHLTISPAVDDPTASRDTKEVKPAAAEEAVFHKGPLKIQIASDIHLEFYDGYKNITEFLEPSVSQSNSCNVMIGFC
eukprot:m.221643 g.221643  ORF g.221643 m.221643 type:complete len:118 (+) comp15928_c0_seq27:441-794(+)